MSMLPVSIKCVKKVIGEIDPAIYLAEITGKYGLEITPEIEPYIPKTLIVEIGAFNTKDKTALIDEAWFLKALSHELSYHYLQYALDKSDDNPYAPICAFVGALKTLANVEEDYL